MSASKNADRFDKLGRRSRRYGGDNRLRSADRRAKLSEVREICLESAQVLVRCAETGPGMIRRTRVRPIVRWRVESHHVNSSILNPCAVPRITEPQSRFPRRRRPVRSLPLRSVAGPGLLLAFLVPLAGGCQEPEKRISIAQRNERMRTIIHEFYERERLSPENIKQLGELGEELERRHQEDLQNTLQMAEERLQSDFRHWQEMEPMRREQLQNVLGSEPERIEQNWSMMVD